MRVITVDELKRWKQILHDACVDRNWTLVRDVEEEIKEKIGREQ